MISLSLPVFLRNKKNTKHKNKHTLNILHSLKKKKEW